MKHELGNLSRIYNRVTLENFKKSDISRTQTIYEKLQDYDKHREINSSKLPIFEEDEDLVFAFPIILGNNREITAKLEVRYGLRSFSRHDTNNEALIISHIIKSIAIVKDGEYLHWSNIITFRNYHDEPGQWEMRTSIDLKKIIQLILETPSIKPKKGVKPNKTIEEYMR